MIELNQPNDEKCGNCKFCLSRKIMLPTMMPLSKPVEETIYQCHRYPTSGFTTESNWCGEWKLRYIVSHNESDVIHLIH